MLYVYITNVVRIYYLCCTYILLMLYVYITNVVHLGSTLLVLLDHGDHVSQLQFVPNENLTLISSSYDGTIKVSCMFIYNH